MGEGYDSRNEMSRVRKWMWAGDGSLSQKGLCECILPNYIRKDLVKRWLAARPAACGCEVMANGVVRSRHRVGRRPARPPAAVRF